MVYERVSGMVVGIIEVWVFEVGIVEFGIFGVGIVEVRMSQVLHDLFIHVHYVFFLFLMIFSYFNIISRLCSVIVVMELISHFAKYPLFNLKVTSFPGTSIIPVWKDAGRDEGIQADFSDFSEFSDFLSCP